MTEAATKIAVPLVEREMVERMEEEELGTKEVRVKAEVKVQALGRLGFRSHGAVRLETTTEEGVANQDDGAPQVDHLGLEVGPDTKEDMGVRRIDMDAGSKKTAAKRTRESASAGATFHRQKVAEDVEETADVEEEVRRAAALTVVVGAVGLVAAMVVSVAGMRFAVAQAAAVGPFTKTLEAFMTAGI